MEMNFNEGEQIRRFLLIVDDEYINREILGAMLDDEYNVLYAVNGREAIDVVRENKAMLSCILLDLMMPEMDGFEVMEQLHADKSLSTIPIIVLTSEQAAVLDDKITMFSCKRGLNYIKKTYFDTHLAFKLGILMLFPTPTLLGFFSSLCLTI